MKFHLDESFDGRVAIGLRNRGHDCTTSKESDLLAATDEQLFDYAIQSGRVLLTRDSDFATLHAALLSSTDPSHSGIIFLCNQKHFGTVIREIDQLASDLSSDEFRDQLFYL